MAGWGGVCRMQSKLENVKGAMVYGDGVMVMVMVNRKQKDLDKY